MDLDSARVAFLQEARELLDQMENGLLDIEARGVSEDSINALFRAAHTIKGSAGLFGLETVVGFTHSLESVLDEVRSERLPVDEDLFALLLSASDHLQLLIDGVEKNLTDAQTEPELRKSLLQRLAVHIPKRTNVRNARAVVPATRELAENAALEPKVEVLPGRSVENDAWHISLRLSPDVLQNGMDPISFLRYLEGLGKITHIDVIEDSLPCSLEELNAEELYLGFEIQFESKASRKDIEAVFEFVAEGSIIRILAPNSHIEEYLSLLAALPESNARLGEILLSCGALTTKELKDVLSRQEESAIPKVPIGEILVEQEIVHPVVVAAALQKQKTRERQVSENRVIRVEVEKLDALINLVGELVIANAAARIATVSEGAKASEEAVANLGALVENIRDSALGLRMVPIGEVFQRFPRVVRDLAKELGKRIDLEITGADTELDKSMVDRIADPLTHIVRNSLDHGIEAEADRIAAGKDPKGTVRFHAYHETGSIVIEVSDDGGGIRRDRVKARAIERGLITQDQQLTDAEILNLIFEPGFSTAEAVTNLSGRGVGMDVVKKSIEALRGEIELSSTEGQGTRMRLRMPLTLAIIDGFLVGVAGQSYVVPLDMVVECADHGKASASSREDGLVNLRGEPLPLVRLREVFGICKGEEPKESILVVEYGNRRAGLVVDRLHGEFQTVIKPLSGLFAGLQGIGGSTILGSGEVALILDVPALVQRLEQSHGRRAMSRQNQPVHHSNLLENAACPRH
jgi:two-component system chemotaxis sensor kinase CheA